MVKTKENDGVERPAKRCEWTKAGDAQASAAAAAAAEQQAFPIVLLSFDWGYVKLGTKSALLHTDKRKREQQQEQEQEESEEKHLF